MMCLLFLMILFGVFVLMFDMIRKCECSLLVMLVSVKYFWFVCIVRIRYFCGICRNLFLKWYG